MKMIKAISIFLLVIFSAFALLSCSGFTDDRVGIYVNIGAEGIQSMEIDFWCGDKLRNTTGVSNADNTAMKIGQAFGFDTPQAYSGEIVCDITFVNTDGEEINSEKTKVSLPADQTLCELEVFKDNEGEYCVRILSVKKEY